MPDPVRVMVEKGKKRRSVVSAFDWPGLGRYARTEAEALTVLAAYRPRYAKIAALAGLSEEFAATGDLEVVERLDGIGMTDMYGVSMKSAKPEYDQISDAECERKIALLRASWAYFDDVAARVSDELRKGPRGGGRDRDRIVRHANGAADPGVRGQGRDRDRARSVAERPRTEGGPPCPPRGILCGAPRAQRSGRTGALLDGPVPDPP